MEDEIYTIFGVIIVFGLFVILPIIGIILSIRHIEIRSKEKAKQRELQKKIDEQRKQEILKELEKVKISDNRHDYIVSNEDYKRGLPKENAYRKMYLLSLLEIFGNKCANCGTKNQGIDIDHFFLSKNEGGCFIMKHKDGYFVNNAVPLCQTCNRSKGDKNYKEFYKDEAKILELFQKNVAMTKLLNNEADS